MDSSSDNDSDADTSIPLSNTGRDARTRLTGGMVGLTAGGRDHPYYGGGSGVGVAGDVGSVVSEYSESSGSKILSREKILNMVSASEV
jgi:hypothetical protein